MPQEYQPHSQQTPLMSRRKALKLLVASGGAVTAAAMLSGQWMKPVVEVGLLPAHAQGSVVTYTLTAQSTTTPGGTCWVTDVVATMTPPVAGVDIQATYQIISGSGSAPAPVVATTNSAGVASFPDMGAMLGSTTFFNLIFTFVNQTQYGLASDTLGPFNEGNC